MSENFKKLVLTSKGEEAINTLDPLIEYRELTSHEQEIADLGMYVSSVYTENKFLDLTEYSFRIAMEEMVGNPLNTSNEVFEKIMRGINNGLVKLINY